MTKGPPKRSVTIAGHRTSLSLEPEFWQAINQLARSKGQSLNQLITDIDKYRGERNLSSACRVHILNYLQAEKTSG